MLVEHPLVKLHYIISIARSYHRHMFSVSPIPLRDERFRHQRILTNTIQRSMRMMAPSSIISDLLCGTNLLIFGFCAPHSRTSDVNRYWHGCRLSPRVRSAVGLGFSTNGLPGMCCLLNRESQVTMWMLSMSDFTSRRLQSTLPAIVSGITFWAHKSFVPPCDVQTSWTH